MKKQKIYKIEKDRNNRTTNVIGTLQELTDYHSYTLEVGASWQHETGNKKINREPKSIKSLVTNLNNAKNNAAANGYSPDYYMVGHVTETEKENHLNS